MRFSILLTFFVLNSLIALAQTKPSKIDEEIMQGEIQRDSLVSRFDFAVACIRAGNLDSGRTLLHEIVNSRVLKWDYSKWVRHKSAWQIYDSYNQQHNYDSALHWLYLSDTVYGISSNCGNAYEDYWDKSNLNFVELLAKTGNYKETEKYLLETAINYSIGDSVKNLNKIRSIFIEHEDTRSLRQKFDIAITKYYKGSWDNMNQRYCFYRHIIFLGFKMYTEAYCFSYAETGNKKKISHQAFIKKIKTTPFYKMLVDLEKS